jgi:hypothetical protein
MYHQELLLQTLERLQGLVEITLQLLLSEKSGDQSGVGTSSNVKITFETEIVDTDNAFASSKFTIPSGEAGKYVFFMVTLEIILVLILILFK